MSSPNDAISLYRLDITNYLHILKFDNFFLKLAFIDTFQPFRTDNGL